MKAVPGRKSDLQDAEWIADLLRHGLLGSSFIPSREPRDLRELTRPRSLLAGKRAQAANELQKSLESANIKLQSVVTDITGASSMEMLQELSKWQKQSPGVGGSWPSGACVPKSPNWKKPSGEPCAPITK